MKSVYQTTELWAKQRQLNVEAFDEIGSTNNEAKSEAADLDDQPKLYLAAHQTNGRGRGKNTWLDTGAGENLLSSWSFQLPQPPQSITGPRIGEALYRAAHSVWPTFPWSLKPPNDLYLNDQKVAGLLVETVSQGSSHRLIIGLGMNVLNHPRAITNATHFKTSSNSLNESEWYQFLDVLLNQFKSSLAEIVLPHLNNEIRSNLLTALNAFPFKKEPYLDVTSNGDLVTKSGTVSWMVQ
jgi:BirA family transcriptional regulator, biotin operon repressor / biotin---[acetyl-CoA-carboxylase] ligase